LFLLNSAPPVTWRIVSPDVALGPPTDNGFIPEYSVSIHPSMKKGMTDLWTSLIPLAAVRSVGRCIPTIAWRSDKCLLAITVSAFNLVLTILVQCLIDSAGQDKLTARIPMDLEPILYVPALSALNVSRFDGMNSGKCISMVLRWPCQCTGRVPPNDPENGQQFHRTQQY
jgi:hypothetical protein